MGKSAASTTGRNRTLGDSRSGSSRAICSSAWLKNIVDSLDYDDILYTGLRQHVPIKPRKRAWAEGEPGKARAVVKNPVAADARIQYRYGMQMVLC